MRGFSVWESFVYILNGVIFLLIGLELPEIVEGLRSKGIPLSTAIGYGLLVTGILILARIISSYTAMLATIIFRPSVAHRMNNGRNRARRWMMPLILGWTGMRGVVSLAAALAIPVTLDDGTAFPYRNLILFITFVVILLTLLVQGLTLPYIIKRTNLLYLFEDDKEDEAMMQNLRTRLREHSYQFLKNKYDNELGDHAGMQKFLHHLEEKRKAANDEWMNEKTKIFFSKCWKINGNFWLK
ncbi:cation:proton antiporter domain-containing protein [Niabella ginsengisoli]|uniref:cation:proton antiporter domain-containing protein n=1 Tax=Niabella ginsengisoli TaxID=522298 RepID=UPI00293E5B5C|nr:cation:proton antiporter [Niabella ginsengisoli]